MLTGHGQIIDPLTNSATTWFNDCGDRGGDDHNTHTTRAVIPAPEVEKEIAMKHAARWDARVPPMTAGHYVEVTKYITMQEVPSDFYWHSSCTDDQKRVVTSGMYLSAPVTCRLSAT